MLSIVDECRGEEANLSPRASRRFHTIAWRKSANTRRCINDRVYTCFEYKYRHPWRLHHDTQTILFDYPRHELSHAAQGEEHNAYYDCVVFRIIGSLMIPLVETGTWATDYLTPTAYPFPRVNTSTRDNKGEKFIIVSVSWWLSWWGETTPAPPFRSLDGSESVDFHIHHGTAAVNSISMISKG